MAGFGRPCLPCLNASLTTQCLRNVLYQWICLEAHWLPEESEIREKNIPPNILFGCFLLLLFVFGQSINFVLNMNPFRWSADRDRCRIGLQVPPRQPTQLCLCSRCRRATVTSRINESPDPLWWAQAHKTIVSFPLFTRHTLQCVENLQMDWVFH